MVMGQPMAMPVMPNSAMTPYGHAPAIGPVHGYAVQHFDHTMAPRGHMSYQPGMMHAPPMGPAYLHQPQDPYGISMGDMTNNMHYPNNMGPQYADRAPMPRRASHHNANLLYDPYGGANRKFSDTSAYNSGSKRGGPGNFTAQLGRGRKVSTSSGRVAYNSNPDHAANIPANSGRYTDFNSRRRFSEDDPNVTGDPVAGCAQNWIGTGNSTVTELWIGDLPVDAHEDELRLLFQQKVGITPTAISIKDNPTKGICHAFAT
jgi:hypothetical protein